MAIREPLGDTCLRRWSSACRRSSTRCCMVPAEYRQAVVGSWSASEAFIASLCLRRVQGVCLFLFFFSFFFFWSHLFVPSIFLRFHASAS